MQHSPSKLREVDTSKIAQVCISCTVDLHHCLEQSERLGLVPPPFKVKGTGKRSTCRRVAITTSAVKDLFDGGVAFVELQDLHHAQATVVAIEQIQALSCNVPPKEFGFALFWKGGGKVCMYVDE